MDALFGVDDAIDRDDFEGPAAGGTTPPSKGGAGELIQIKRQMQQYLMAKERDEMALQEVRAEMDVLKRRIVELQASKRSGIGGSTNAIAENNRALAKHSELMERKLVKARAAKMTALSTNAELREKINELRREKVTIIMLQHALNEDSANLAADSLHMQEKLGGIMHKIEELDAQTGGLHEESKIEIAQLEAEVKRLIDDEKNEDVRTAALEMLSTQAPASSSRASLAVTDPVSAAQQIQFAARHKSATGAKERRDSGAKGKLDPIERPMSRQIAALIASGKQPSIAELRSTARMTMTTLRDSASQGDIRADALPALGRSSTALAGASRSQTATTSRLLQQSRWAAAFTEAQRKSVVATADLLREAFDRAMAITRATSVDEFVAKFQEAQAENEVLYKRVADAVSEADGMRASLVQDWAVTAAKDEKEAAKDAERLAVISSAASKAGSLSRKCGKMREHNTQLTAIVDSARRGLLKLIDVLQGEVSAIEDTVSDTDGAVAPEPSTITLSGGSSFVEAKHTESVEASSAPSTQQITVLPQDKQQQDVMTLYVKAETLLATVLAMYSRFLHGVRLPLALPASALASTLQSFSSGSQHSGTSNLSRLMSLAPLSHGASKSHTAEHKHGARQARRSDAGLHHNDEIPAARHGLVTLTASERRASLEMSLIDMRKGLLAEAAKSPSGQPRSKSSKARGGSAGRDTPSRQHAHTSRGELSPHGDGMQRTASHRNVQGTSRSPPLASPKSARTGSRTPGLSDGMQSARGTERSGVALPALNTNAPILHPSYDGEASVVEPVIDLSTLRVGPDSPSRMAPGTLRPGGRASAGTIQLANGVTIVPPSVEGPAASQILAQARGEAGVSTLSLGAMSARSGMLFPAASSRSLVLNNDTDNSPPALFHSTTGV